jgi:hypothetical protein
MTKTELHDTGRNILNQFTKVSHAIEFLKLSNESESEENIAFLLKDVQSERERFQLWAANLGLFVIGDRSLDYRTRDHATVKEYTKSLLDELEEDLSESKLSKKVR